MTLLRSFSAFVTLALLAFAPCHAAVLSDPLLVTPPRAAGVSLNGLRLAAGDAVWHANSGVVIAADGVTASAPSGGHHVVPAVIGTYALSADLLPRGCGFAGLALGRGDLSGNFWVNLDVLFYVRETSYGLMVGGKEQLKGSDPALLRHGTANHLELRLDTRARTVSAAVNGKSVADALALPAGAVTQPITAAGFRFNEPVVAGQPRASAYRAEVTSLAAGNLVPSEPQGFIVEPGQRQTLRWTVGSPGPTPDIPYTLRDYTGRSLGGGVTTMSADGTVAIEPTLPAGYAEVTFPEAGQRFGVLALARRAGPRDPFFGIDAALTWLETRRGTRESLVAAMARVGIAMARERLNVGLLNGQPDTYHWGYDHGDDTLRAAYQAAGVPVLELFWGNPPQFEAGLSKRFPQNLVAEAHSWEAVSRHYGSSWGGYEVGNEPDIDQPGMPADQYVATVKAAACASDRVTPRPPVIGGVFANVPPGPYFATAQANGLLDTVDGLSFHQYDRAPAMEGQVRAYRDYLRAGGHEGLPLWLTECGHPWTMGPDRPPMAEDAASAMEIAAKAVEARACGVARFCPFVLPFYEEGGIKSFGMFGREATPLRSFAAYAQAIAALSGLDYRGDLPLGEPAKRARVFGADQGDWVAVVYSGEARPSVALPIKPRRAAGADGRDLPLAADGTLPLPDGLSYAWFDPQAVRGLLRTDTAAAALTAASRRPEPVRPPASPLLLQFSYQPELGQISKAAYYLSKATAAALPLTVRLQNLGDAPLTVTPSLQLPGAGGVALAHAPVTVPAKGIAEAHWQVDASRALDCCEVRHLVVTATCADAPRILPLALPMLVEGDLAEVLSRFRHQQPLPIAELARWQPRAGHGSERFASPDGKTWRMDLTFERTGDAWAFPYFKMPTAIDPRTATGMVIRGRVMQPGNNIMLILVDGAADIRANDLFVPDGQWHAVYVPFDQLRYFTAGMQNEPLHLDRVNTLGIGLCSRVLTNTMEVSDMVLVGP